MRRILLTLLAVGLLGGCTRFDLQTYMSSNPVNAPESAASAASGASPMDAEGIRITFVQIGFNKFFRYLRVVYEATNLTDNEIVFDPALFDLENPETGASWIHARKGDPNAKRPPIRGKSRILVNLLFRGVTLEEAPKKLRVIWKGQSREFVMGESIGDSDAQEVFKNRGAVDIF